MMQQRNAIQFIFRGSTVTLDDFVPGRTLLDWLRREQRACGVKEGCAEGDCGACTVILRRIRNGSVVWLPVNACIALLGQADGAEILTVEDLETDGKLHPVQDALVRHHGSQCGFCTPGIAMSLTVLHATQPGTLQPGTLKRADAVDALAGNLCRCTGYKPILDAAQTAATQSPAQGFADARMRADADLARLQNKNDVFVGTAAHFFAAPASEHALALLASEHPDAIFIGGATDYGLRITKEMAQPHKLIWLDRVEELKSIQTGDNGITIGAGVTIASVMQCLGGMDPDIAEMLRRFGSPQVRASGTIGGNIANGSPVGDLPPLLIALGAEVELRKGDVLRRMPLEQFFLGYRKQDRQPGEFVRAISVPVLKSDERVRVFKLSKRFDEDISSVLLALKVTVSNHAITGRAPRFWRNGRHPGAGAAHGSGLARCYA